MDFDMYQEVHPTTTKLGLKQEEQRKKLREEHELVSGKNKPIFKVATAGNSLEPSNQHQGNFMAQNSMMNTATGFNQAN